MRSTSARTSMLGSSSDEEVVHDNRDTSSKVFFPFPTFRFGRFLFPCKRVH
jgi:hypothetical protein